MSADVLLGLAIGIVVGAAVIVSAGIHGYVLAVKEHGRKYHPNDRDRQ